MGDAAAIEKEIGECGAKVRDLKTSKGDKAAVDAAVKALLAAKAKYKEVTGKDFGPPPSDKKSKKGKKAAAPAPAPAAGGDKPKSKKELNKEAKKAKKDAQKGAGASQPAAKAVLAAKSVPCAKGGKGINLKVEGGSAGTLKCLVTAAASGVSINTTGVSKSSLPFGVAPSMEVDGTVIFGANAICQYFALSGSAAGALSAEEAAVQEWMEWDETKLGSGGDKELKEAEGLIKGPYLCGDKLTLADTTAGVALSLGKCAE
jgi:hypothetical protein